MFKHHRTIAVALFAITAMLVGSTTPVSAKKPVKPTTVEVTIEAVVTSEGIFSDGIFTTCGPDSLLMTQESADFLRADWADAGSQVEMNLAISWERAHPSFESGDTFTGCHGGLITGSGPGFAGYFILDGGADGTVLLSSRFDYFWAFDWVEVGRSGKTREVQTVLEFFEITAELHRTDGEPFDWSASGDAQVVGGWLEMQRFEKLVDNGGVGWEPFGGTDVVMEITINEA